MKKKVIVGLVFLFFLAVVPMSVFVDIQKVFSAVNFPSDATADSVSADIFPTEKSDLQEDFILSLAAQSELDWSDEKILCLAVLINNNLKAGEEIDKSDANIFIPEEDLKTIWGESYEKNFARYSKIAENSVGYSLLYKGKHVVIPLYDISNGSTAENENFAYLSAVASPWDAQSKEFDPENTEAQPGISLAGLDYLLNLGASPKEAFEWFLPEFEVQ